MATDRTHNFLGWMAEISSIVSWLKPSFLEWGGKLMFSWAPVFCWGPSCWILLSFPPNKVSDDPSVIWSEEYLLSDIGYLNCSLVKLFSSFLTCFSLRPVCFLFCLLEGKAMGRGQAETSWVNAWACPGLTRTVSLDQCLWTNFASSLCFKIIQRLSPESCLCVPDSFNFNWFKARALSSLCLVMLSLWSTSSSVAQAYL